MSSPVGLVIGGNKVSNQWKVGKEIGSGACASVHLLIGPDGKQSDFVVKLTPLPQKTTKQKKTIPERNARLLYHEGLLYQNTFPEYQGFILPGLPRSSDGPPITGDTEGFRFLTMEKMESPLFNIVPRLLNTASDSINVGSILQQLLICVESFHNEDHLLVDIKPENFMIAKKAHNRSNLKRKGKNTTEEDLGEKVRALDIALSTRWKGMHGGHRPDEGIGEVIGTPLYSSRNLHDKHTPSRRDDMEALLIVIAELIIRIVAESNGESSKFEGSGKNKIPTYLPWSNEKSDDAIGAKKANELKDPKSSFYKRMGDANVAKKMHSLFELTSGMKYKDKPDYEKFHDVFSNFWVKVQPPKENAATKAPRPSRYTRSKRAASPADVVEVNESPSPKKHPKATKDDQDDFYDAEMEVEAEEFVDANEVEEMDWEVVKENRVKIGSSLGVTITVTGGPHKGEHFDLTKGGTEAIIVGKNQSLKKGAAAAEALWLLPNDPNVEDMHAKLELKFSKKLCSVKVLDMKSAGGIFIGSKKLPRGKEAQCFINDKFQIGQTVFCIKTLSSQPVGEEANKKPKSAKSKAQGKVKPLAEKNESPATVDSNTAADVTIKVVKGPHKGESFALVLNETEIINLGSTLSSAKKGVPVVLDSDPGIENNHARFQLRGSKRMFSVAVTDLSESGTLEVNGKQIPKGKEHIAFMNDTLTLTDVTTLKIARG